MNEKITVEDATDRLEAIARSRRVQDAIGEMATRVETANRLEKASCNAGMRNLAGAVDISESEGAVSGAAVLRSLGEMCKDAN